MRTEQNASDIPDSMGLSSLVERLVEKSKSEINCVSVGTVQAFNEEDQTVSVSINYKRVVKGAVTVERGKVTDRVIDYPLLINCPIFILGGVAGVTVPVTAGDTCIVLFADRDIDAWLDTGNVSAVPNSKRKHSLSDAIALVGIRSKANAVEGYENNKIKVFHGGSYISIDDSGDIDIVGGVVNVNANEVNINT